MEIEKSLYPTEVREWDNHELTLISYKVDKDEIGNDITIPIKKKILCKVADIGSMNLWMLKCRLKPEIKFIVHEFEYEEKKVKFEGERYEVLRTYRKIQDRRKEIRQHPRARGIELTCEKVIGHGVRFISPDELGVDIRLSRNTQKKYPSHRRRNRRYC